MTTIRAVHVDRFEYGLAVLVNPSGRQWRVPQSCVYDLPPAVTEAERRLVEAVLTLLSSAGVHTANAMHRAAEAVLAERKPPDPPDPVDPGAEVLAAWEEWTEEGVDPSRLNLAMIAFAASRSDKT